MNFLYPKGKPDFPDVEEATYDGLVAVGGKINKEWLLDAYSKGIFPWFDQEPILWFSPDPRAVMTPNDVKVSKSMRVYFNQNKFELKIDNSFEKVILNCSKIKRNKQKGTWINKIMIENYTELHNSGFAHSFETWKNDELVGGLYGVSLGKSFFGESMFSKETNASKFAFISMCKILEKNDFHFIDCQLPNPHLETLGCKTIPRKKFSEMLKISNSYPTLKGNWNELLKL